MVGAQASSTAKVKKRDEVTSATIYMVGGLCQHQNFELSGSLGSLHSSGPSRLP